MNQPSDGSQAAAPQVPTCQPESAAPKTTEHFRLIIGYDAKTDEIIYHEPAEDKGAGRRMSRKQF